MRRAAAAAVLVLVLALVAALAWLRGGGGDTWYTGFVEGEERVLRSEVPGRVLEVAFAEGDAVPAGAVVARLDDSDVAARIASQRAETAVLDAEIRRQEEQVRVVEETTRHDVAARRAELSEARSAAALAGRDLGREQGLFEEGAASTRSLDARRTQHEQATSSLQRARELLRRAEAEEGNVALAKRQLEVLRQQRELAAARLAELEVTLAKHAIRAPDVATVVQTQLLWPGELAQVGTPVLSVLDPRDKYVQIYVPVADVDRVRVGTPVSIELDSAPGQRFRGEVSFLADQANFTPEKIETRSDRLGQVYRAKVRILESVERFQPGTEGNVHLLDGAPPRAARAERAP